MQPSSDSPNSEQTSEIVEPVLSSETIQDAVPDVGPDAGSDVIPDAIRIFFEKLQSFQTVEEKISCGLEFMRSAISQEGSPHFREFWEARRLVLPLFKDNVNPAIRSKLWGEYVELTAEARRLKDILEEQSAFAAEQIELAVVAMEKDMARFDELLKESESVVCPDLSQTILQRAASYEGIQKELNLLNTLASRLNGLRKEILKTDMRIRFKTKFIKRLSQLGDAIFPKRKELIELVSSEFEKDVDHFIATHFLENEVAGAPYYAIREEIKGLQGMAKFVTLSSSAFSRIRLKLSECWDKLRVVEKEYKKEVLQQRQQFSEQRKAIQEKIDALKPLVAEMTLAALDTEIHELQKIIRDTSLHREDVRSLRDELNALREPHLAEQEKRARELEAAEKEKIRLKKEAVAQFKERVAALLREGSQLELEPLAARYDQLVLDLKNLELIQAEKQPLERLLRPLRDLVADKKEHSLLNLSEDDRKTLENLRTVLQQKKERRQEIKGQLETHRKSLGASGLDFEQAMHYRELVDQEKERLEKANQGIEEVERRISELEG
jgi:hypothetical protein